MLSMLSKWKLAWERISSHGILSVWESTPQMAGSRTCGICHMCDVQFGLYGTEIPLFREDDSTVMLSMAGA